MTTNLTVGTLARIDALEGPNLESLMKPWLILVHSQEANLSEAIESISFRFDRVAFFDDKEDRIDPHVVGELITPRLISIGVLGDDIKSVRNGDFILKFEFLGVAFQGHYNTNKRKGSFQRVK